MVTLKEIARECNVSPTTISNILNGKPKVSEETRQRVMETVDRMGYRPNYFAQGLRKQRTKTIGLVAEDIAQFTTPEVVEGIMNRCEKKGYRAIVKNLRLYARWSDLWFHKESEYHSILDPTMKELQSFQVDGIIYIAGHGRVIDCFPEGFKIPAVMAYAFAENPQIPSVAIDDRKSAYEIVKYLISKGHRKIGVISGKEGNLHTKERLLGYQRALYESRILYNPVLVRYAGWDKESAYQEAKELLKQDITAVFCMADRMAGGVYRLLAEMGLRVGADIAVAGFDNQDIAEYFVPGLTTMALPLKEIGQTSADLLLDRLEGARAEEQGQNRFLIPCTFIERESVHTIS
ncbi:MAG: LacI family DNA-binding transcriptional regulator [Lachnospiraceae bacterium]